MDAGPPDPTWADLKQLGWGLLLVYAVIALLGVLSRSYFGGRATLWVCLGLAAFVTVAFALLTGASLLVSYGAGGLARFRRRGQRPPPPPPARPSQ